MHNGLAVVCPPVALLGSGPLSRSDDLDLCHCRFSDDVSLALLHLRKVGLSRFGHFRSRAAGNADVLAYAIEHSTANLPVVHSSVADHLPVHECLDLDGQRPLSCSPPPSTPYSCAGVAQLRVMHGVGVTAIVLVS